MESRVGKFGKVAVFAFALGLTKEYMHRRQSFVKQSKHQKINMEVRLSLEDLQLNRQANPLRPQLPLKKGI